MILYISGHSTEGHVLCVEHRWRGVEGVVGNWFICYFGYQRAVQARLTTHTVVQIYYVDVS